jgi:hypothetical protein
VLDSVAHITFNLLPPSFRYRAIADHDRIMNHVVFERITESQPTDCPTAIFETIISPCWRHTAAERPSFRQLVANIEKLMPVKQLGARTTIRRLPIDGAPHPIHPIHEMRTGEVHTRTETNAMSLKSAASAASVESFASSNSLYGVSLFFSLLCFVVSVFLSGGARAPPETI